MAKLNPYQIAIARTYAGGEFEHFADLDTGELSASLADCGDTLFAFLMIELSDNEGCDDRREALRRIDRAQSDLRGAWMEIDNLPAGEA